MTGKPEYPIQVAVGILYDTDGRFLLSSRPADKPYGGWWEFAGGKIEPGETPFRALQREFEEELGITILSARRWLTVTHQYEHSAVCLRFFKISPSEYTGIIEGREGQQWAWQKPECITVSPVLPANSKLLEALLLPEVFYGNRNTGFSGIGPDGKTTTLPPVDFSSSDGLHPIAFSYQNGNLLSVGRIPSAAGLFDNNPDTVVFPVYTEEAEDLLFRQSDNGFPVPVWAALPADCPEDRVRCLKASGIHGIILDDAGAPPAFSEYQTSRTAKT